jgi:hypothetical protein
MLADLKTLIKALGTYWTTYYKEKPWFVGLMNGQTALQRQAEQNLTELELSAYRKLIPVYHTELVWAFTLRIEDKNKTAAAIPQYGISDEYHLIPPVTDATPRYGVPIITDNWYDIGLTNLVDIESIVDRLVNPTITLKRGKDFEIRNNAVIFYQNLLEDKESLQLFAINAKEDRNWIYRHFGILVHLNAGESSAAFRQIVDDLFNCYIDGCSVLNVLTVLAAVTGNVIAKEEETVIDVAGGVVVTNKNTYHLPDRQPCVAKDSKLRAGDSLTTSFTPIYINTLDRTDELPGVVLGSKQLKHYYRGELCFFNREEQLYSINGLKRFHLGGWPGDTDEFWKTFHKNCEERGQRGNTVLTNLAYKGTINPYRFFTDEIGRYHYTLLKIRQESRPTPLNIDDIRIRTILPPWNALIIHVDTVLQHNMTLSSDANDEVTVTDNSVFETTINLPERTAGKLYCHIL